MINKLKLFYQQSGMFKYLSWIVEIPYHYKKKFITDISFIQSKYNKVFGRKGDFFHPKTLNEVISYRKLYDRRELYTICSDKFAVRDFVKKIIGEKYLIPLVNSYDSVDDIELQKLPSEFVIKINHGSGQNLVVRDSLTLNQAHFFNQLSYWFGKNHYYNSREWQYKAIAPKVIVEKLLLDKQNKVPNDYKLHCINGKVEFIQMDVDRFGEHSRAFYSRYWKEMDFMWTPLKDGKAKYTKASPQPKPANLSEMNSLAEKLAVEFYYVRVDLYTLDDDIFFGELTFSHGNGCEVFLPAYWDEHYGNLVQLNYPENKSK